MPLDVLLKALIEFETNHRAVIPTYWTLGSVQIPLSIEISQDSNGRLKFGLSIPATTIPL